MASVQLGYSDAHKIGRGFRLQAGLCFIQLRDKGIALGDLLLVPAEIAHNLAKLDQIAAIDR